uniref:Uncharacterized protein n=1 Tax=Fibrocapsa japonica TaxID=94617 RepID=A0A7S2UVH0_9STRA|mmetsp:Transcript_11994/g.17670  ORF Transcript_11994/g.17670 Transcript_11994/m.17670 type:complete len:209 (+) Transcript_11994:35-661(+)|eukprot:CAMPEP_0113934056 /NCGR_PEP_ID=MMETSP1339-20121228/1384_1 /TAXON_ID=94617 /ORGANISM="Fibrocapsa japonica" /LENGTH=208 /DNA_ID=CAMNT_0000935673 /DNA_START=30 /DNA_END=656 /DNA_ORIENTATION=+ /assembly_acc=CAM_ASM_000762
MNTQTPSDSLYAPVGQEGPAVVQATTVAPTAPPAETLYAPVQQPIEAFTVYEPSPVPVGAPPPYSGPPPAYTAAPAPPVQQQQQGQGQGQGAGSRSKGAVIAGAAAVGAVAGAAVAGPLLGVVGAGAAAVAATRQDETGQVARAAGNMGCALYEKAKELDKEHKITNMVSAEAGKAWREVQQFDKDNNISGKAAKGIIKGLNSLSKKL